MAASTQHAGHVSPDSENLSSDQSTKEVKPVADESQGLQVLHVCSKPSWIERWLLGGSIYPAGQNKRCDRLFALRMFSNFVGFCIGVAWGFINAYAVLQLTPVLPWAVMVGIAGCLLNWVLYRNDIFMVCTLFVSAPGYRTLKARVDDACQSTEGLIKGSGLTIDRGDSAQSQQLPTEKASVARARGKWALLLGAVVFSIIPGVAMLGLTYSSVQGMLVSMGLVAPGLIATLAWVGALTMAWGTFAITYASVVNVIIDPSAFTRFIWRTMLMGPKPVLQRVDNLSGKLLDLGEGRFCFQPNQNIEAGENLVLKIVDGNLKIVDGNNNRNNFDCHIKVTLPMEVSSGETYEFKLNPMLIERLKDEAAAQWHTKTNRGFDTTRTANFKRIIRVLLMVGLLTIGLIAAIVVVAVWQQDFKGLMLSTFSWSDRFCDTISRLLVGQLTFAAELVFIERCAINIAKQMATFFTDTLCKVPVHLRDWGRELKDAWQNNKLVAVQKIALGGVALLGTALVAINAYANGILGGQGARSIPGVPMPQAQVLARAAEGTVSGVLMLAACTADDTEVIEQQPVASQTLLHSVATQRDGDKRSDDAAETGVNPVPDHSSSP